MPVSSHHPQYSRKVEDFRSARDCYEGERSMKEAGTRYVPKLSGMPGGMMTDGTGLIEDEYKKYINRGMFYGATYRTVRALVGAVCRKAPVVKIPSRIEKIGEDATSSGVSLEEFTKQVIGETFLQGRGGILVDRKADGSLPYFCFYQAESIINWGEDEKKKFVILKETVYVPKSPDDPYETKAVNQYREVIHHKNLDPEKQFIQIKVHQQREAKEGESGEPFNVISDITLKKRNGNLTRFPFVFVSPDSRSNKVEKSPMQDLVNVNISHWRNSVDLECGRHILGLPTPYMTGVDSTNKDPVALGPTTCVKLTDPNSKFAFAEFTGAGLTELRIALKEKEELMASLGARILSSQKSATETAETAKIHAAGEDNALSSIVNGVEEAIEAALEVACDWEGEKPESVEFEMSRDFTNIKMDAATLTAMLQVVQGNKMSIETFVWNIAQGEMLPPGRTVEDEIQLIKKQQEEAAELQAKLFEKAGSIQFGGEDGPTGSKKPTQKPGEGSKGAVGSSEGSDKTGSGSGQKAED